MARAATAIADHLGLAPGAVPDAETCVTGRLLERFAAVTPDKVFIRFGTGEEWTWTETLTKARATAQALQARGVRPGAIVAAWAPNSPALVRAWFGANLAGAALAPINTAFRGRILEQALARTGARLLLLHPALASRLAGLDLGAVERVILTSGVAAELAPQLEVEPPAALDGDPDQAETPTVAPWDTPVVIFTSGTTGPSKAVVTTYFQQWATGRVTYGYMTATDRILVNLPMFHVGGISGITAALAVGASVALYEAFDTRRFWQQVRESEATTCSGFIGALTTFLQKEPPRPDDADNPLRICTLSPVSNETVALAQRYNFDYVTGFNMTELSSPLVSAVNDPAMRSCGRPRSGIECRIVDANDLPVPDGAVGELVVRSSRPWEFFREYLGDPQATADAWRNGWFHTGDLLRRDASGLYYFIDRKKDAIRRRGENMSSMEIEIDVAAYPAVREVAAYGIDLAGGEQAVMICVAPREGESIDPRALVDFLIPRMAHFMVPRYVRVVEALPKTPTNKIQKVALRQEGVTADTWDREAAGLILKREKLAI
jgi:carnitine-CoA ligase